MKRESCGCVKGNLILFCSKQKPAYKMRISDWSSDVCSSDRPVRAEFLLNPAFRVRNAILDGRGIGHVRHAVLFLGPLLAFHLGNLGGGKEIGRASCREECVSTCRSRWSPAH